LCQHHGNATIVDGEIIRRNGQNEETWTGDFRIWTEQEWKSAVRPGAFWYSLIANQDELSRLLAVYDRVHPPKLTRREIPQSDKAFPAQLEWQ
jgi:hypothetical protein